MGVLVACSDLSMSTANCSICKTLCPHEVLQEMQSHHGTPPLDFLNVGIANVPARVPKLQQRNQAEPDRAAYAFPL